MDRDGGLDQPGGFIGVADIGCVRGNLGADSAQCCFRLGQLLGRTRRKHEPAALGSKRLGARQTDAAAGAGDEGLPVSLRSIRVESSAAPPYARALRSAIQDDTWS